MRTSWKLFDVTKFQEEIKVAQKPLWSHNKSAKVSTDGPDDDSQQGPEHTEAQPRADRSAVARCNDADLEQTAAQSRGKMLQISSRQQTSLEKREREREQLYTARSGSRGIGARRASSTRVVREQERSTEASPPTARYKARTAKTDPHSAERRCIAREK